MFMVRKKDTTQNTYVMEMFVTKDTVSSGLGWRSG
jgi:hypothetical protein